MYLIQISAAYKPAYIYGGPTMSVAKLSEVLHDREDIHLEVLTTTANGSSELSVTLEIPTVVDSVSVTYFKRLTKDHTHLSPTLLASLNRKLRRAKRQDPEELPIVHIHAWWNLVSIGACFIAYWNKVPVVLSPRGMLTTYTLGNRNSLLKSILHVMLGKRLLQYCDVHATSLRELEDIQKNFHVKSISVISNFVQLSSAVTAKPAQKQPPLRLIFLSRIEEKKGLEFLFKALKELTFPWELTVAGAGDATYVSSLKDLAENLSIASRINWLGHIDNKHKFQLLANHDLLTLTSYNENFANVVIESLSVGTAVLVSKEVGLSKYVEEHDFGWICELNPQQIAQQLTNVYNYQDKLQQISITAPEQVRLDFSESKLVDKYVALYHRVSKKS